MISKTRSETVVVLFIDQEIGGQGEPTPGEHDHESLASECTNEAKERHGGDMTDDRAEFQTEATMGGHQRIASDLGSHLAIAPDEMRQDGEHGCARRALDAPDGDPAQADAHVMRVAGQAPAAATGRLMLELKAKGEEKGEDELDKRPAVVKELKVGRFIVEIDGDGAVVASLAGRVSHGSSSGQMVSAADDPKWSNTCTISRGSRRVEACHH
jgi:hypothetical protein